MSYNLRSSILPRMNTSFSKLDEDKLDRLGRRISSRSAKKALRSALLRSDKGPCAPERKTGAQVPTYVEL
jgi:hypothetical protein